MANTARPFGLQPVSDDGIVRWNPYYAPASLASLGIGTPVNIGGSANTANVTYGMETPAGTLPSIVVATGGDGNKLLGSIVGFDLIPTNLFVAGYNAASTGRVVHVADDPKQKFIIVDDGQNVLTTSDVGLNANITVGTVDAFTNTDSSSLDTSTPATDATYQLKILGAYNTPGNTIGEAYCTWLVQINNHIFGNVVAGV